MNYTMAISMHWFKSSRLPGARFAALRSLKELEARERRHVVNEIGQVRGLLPLLMKQRNLHRWTAEDRMELREHLLRLSRLSPYMIVLAAPGGIFFLPLMAWWLDRRRRHRDACKLRVRSRESDTP